MYMPGISCQHKCGILSKVITSDDYSFVEVIHFSSISNVKKCELVGVQLCGLEVYISVSLVTARSYVN